MFAINRNIFTLISIQAKAWLIMSILLVLCLILNMIILRSVLLSKFMDLEESQVKQNIERVAQAVAGELKHINTINNDWASWDNSYDFMKTQSPEFIANNLIDGTLPSLNLDMLYFVDRKGRVVWGKSINQKTGRKIDIQELSAGLFSKKHPLIIENIPLSGLTGIYQTGSGPLLLSTAPILDSYGQGPKQGWLIMGRLFDDDMVESLSEQVHLSLSMPFETSPEQIAKDGDTLRLVDSNTFYRVKGIETIQGYSLIEGVAGTEGLLIQVDLPREVYRQGLVTIRVMAFLITITMLSIFLFLSILLKGFIISPITRLTDHILDLEKTKNIKLRLPQEDLRCRDEACILAIQVNKMLDTIEEMHEKLKDDARIDPLTMVANRRCFNEHLSNEWQRLMRSQGRLSIIMCDIDHFKLYNDHYGHQKGDDCLKKVAGLIQAIPHRPYDMVARYGGEEFIIVLPDSNLSDAAFLAEKIREKIQDCRIPHEKSPTDQWVTLSLGVASGEIIMGSKPEDLIKQADNALYKAKELGRNQVVPAGDIR